MYVFCFIQLTLLLGELGLNIQEAHAYSTSDGYSLDIFVVDGWEYEVIQLFWGRKQPNNHCLTEPCIPTVKLSFKMRSCKLKLQVSTSVLILDRYNVQ